MPLHSNEEFGRKDIEIMSEKKKFNFEITSFALHIIAMALMLTDHLGATVIQSAGDWMTCLGRLAFPIFAFMTVEGFFYTSSRMRYALRLLIFALVSEIPFNLMMSGEFFYPMHQNVLWSFLLGIGLMQLNEKAKEKGKWWLRILAGVGAFIIGTAVGMLSAMDYMHFGVWTILTFYFLRGRNWWNLILQAVVLFLINDEVGGLAYEFTLFGQNIFFSKQWLAVLALIPIWLYKGKQGHHSKTFKYICYGFYPVHILILGLMVRFM